MMTPEDLALARTWIGRSETSEDIVAPHLVARFHATLDPFLAPMKSNEAPLGVHWCLAVETAGMDRVDVDGHPKRGAFLPPCPLPKRMAAGGELTLLSPIRIGGAIRRVSTIEDVTLREGKTGQLCFVNVRHDIACDGADAVIEKQTVVFRDAGSSAAAAGKAEEEPADIVDAVSATPALLFRFSAVTFNTHRIHYDRAYAANEEGYPGLVVHGPLQAALLLNLAAKLMGAAPGRFEFRAQAPIFEGPFEIAGRKTGQGAATWTRTQNGRAMSAAASFA